VDHCLPIFAHQSWKLSGRILQNTMDIMDAKERILMLGALFFKIVWLDQSYLSCLDSISKS
jgi:hypothetical protein